VKKLIEKNERKAALPTKKIDEDENNEFVDLWSDEKTNNSRNTAKFKNFTERTRVKVAPVVVPMGGQSYNPSALDHKEVIEKVVEEEKREVEELQRRLRTLKPYLFTADGEATI
jgi:hypothetical protein